MEATELEPGQIRNTGFPVLSAFPLADGRQKEGGEYREFRVDETMMVW